MPHPVGHVRVPRLKESRQVMDHAVVEVLTPEVRVACRGLHLQQPLLHRQKRNIERPAAEVEHHHGALGGSVFAFRLRLVQLIQAVRNGCRGRLVDDAEHLQAGDRTRIFRRLTLRVVEICRNRYDGLGDRMTQVVLCDLLQAPQESCADLLRTELAGLSLVLDLDDGPVGIVAHHFEGPKLEVGLQSGVGKLPADEPLGIKHRVGGVHRHLIDGLLADEPLNWGESHI
mmetsp:Transcript_13680/g.38745  ORF Transcript_13680/g.38745 Transcript_13680/m.38745 type:complete len:229 (-) Transcript_13680:248-934(-)